MIPGNHALYPDPLTAATPDWESWWRSADSSGSWGARVDADLGAWLNRVGEWKDRQVLVTACGLGADARHLAALGAQVTAFDLAAEAVRRAREIDATSPVIWTIADLCDLPSAWTGQFDLVVEIDALQALFPCNQPRAIKMLARVLRPGGRLFFASPLREGGFCSECGPPWPLDLAARLLFVENGLELDEDLSPGPDRGVWVWRHRSKPKG